MFILLLHDTVDFNSIYVPASSKSYNEKTSSNKKQKKLIVTNISTNHGFVENRSTAQWFSKWVKH